MRFEPAHHKQSSRGRMRSRSSEVETASWPISSDLPLPPFKCPTEPNCPGHFRFCVFCYLSLMAAPVTRRTQPLPCKCPKTCPGYVRGKSCERFQEAKEMGIVRKAEDPRVPRHTDSPPQARAPNPQERSRSQPPFARISSVALPKIPLGSLGFLETCALGYQLHWGREVVEETRTAAEHFGFIPPMEYCPDCHELLTFENLNLESLLRLTNLDGSRSDAPAMPCMYCALKRRHRANIKAELIEGYDKLVRVF